MNITMKVKEAIELLMPQIHLILKGSYSGKVYYSSDVNALKIRQKYEEYECTDKPIDTIIKCTDDMAYPCIVIWFKDYELSKQKVSDGEGI